MAEFKSPCLLSETNSKFQNIGMPWYCNKQFERYWSVYSKCMTYTHKDVLSRCTETNNKLAATLYKMVKAPWPGNFSEFVDKKRGSRKRKRKSVHRKQKEKQLRLPKPTPSVFVLTDDDTLQVRLQEQMQIGDDEEKDIDEEFLAFMKTSVMHRIKWNNLKEKTIENEEASTQNLLLGQEEHPDVARDKEMKELYGENAAQIYGMETAMQLSFDRISTLYQPSIWPNIPIRLAF